MDERRANSGTRRRTASMAPVGLALAAILVVALPVSAQERAHGRVPSTRRVRSSAEGSASDQASRRRPTPRKPVSLEDPTGLSWYVIERASADFGLVNPGESRVLDGALIIRVFSDKDWTLRLAPRTTSISAGSSSQAIPASRLALRSPSMGWSPLSEGLPSVIARGHATAAGGEVVILDLRLDLDSRDPVGYFGSELELTLDPM